MDMNPMQRSEGRILVTHTGSLPRPVELISLYARRQAGEPVDPEVLRAVQLNAVRQSVADQAAAGVDVGNNGEQTRPGFFLYLTERMNGFGGGWMRPPRADVERYPLFEKQRQAQMAGRTWVNARETVPMAIGEIRYKDPTLIEEECAELASILTEKEQPFVESFVSAPSPGVVARAMRNSYYDSEAAYLAALGRALKVEYEAIVRSGFILQLDCPDFGLERHVTFKDEPLSAFLEFSELVVDTLNQALENIPRNRVRMHVCWGNYEGPHDCDVPLSDILPVIARAKVGGLVLPFANPRHAHEYLELERIPLTDDQLIVAGVIDTLTNIVEHPEVVADRLVRIAGTVGDPTRVLAGTDCGFDTSAGSGRVAADVVWAKLASLRDGARLASERLFR